MFRQIQLFELIHIDVWGPYHTRTHQGHRYFLTTVDDYSRLTWTHIISTKSNAFSILKAFIQMVKTQLEQKLKL